jgi:hypothetical protein
MQYSAKRRLQAKCLASIVVSLVIPVIPVIPGMMSPSAAAEAPNFRIEEATSAQSFDVAQIKPGTIAFSDKVDIATKDFAAKDDGAVLMPFEEWARTRPAEKKFLALFSNYSEPTVVRHEANAETGPVVQKLSMYVARARFVLDRAPATVDLSHAVTPAFLERIDPAIKHKTIAAADLPPLTDTQGTGNENPDRPWCTGRASLICIQSSYTMEGKIPLGIMLVNKLRDSAKKASDHIDFDGELSLLAPADLDQAGLKELTGLDSPVTGALEQNIFHVNQIMKFGKFLAVFQNHPTDADKTVVTAFMTLAIDTAVLDKKKEYERVPVLRNLVPEQVLTGKSSFNSGESISAGLPKYARNEIKTVADILQRDK